MLNQRINQRYMRRSRAKVNFANMIAAIASVLFSLLCAWTMKDGLVIFLASPSMYVCVKAWLLGNRNDSDVRWFTMFLVALCVIFTLIFK